MRNLVFTVNFGMQSEFWKRESTLDKHGNPIPELTNLNEEVAMLPFRTTPLAYALRCTENPCLGALIVGFDFFKNDYQFLIEKALFSGVTVKLVDFSNHQTITQTPLGFPITTTKSPKVRYLSRLPSEKQTVPGRTKCEWKTRYESPMLQWDTLQSDPHGGRTHASLKPELQHIRKWKRENQNFHYAEWETQAQNIAVQKYRKELEWFDKILPELQDVWDRVIAYCLDQRQPAFVNAGIEVGMPLTRECLPLLQCAYEAEVDHPLSKVEEAELWMSLVFYLLMEEKPTCYNHVSLSPKKWALVVEGELDDESANDEELLVASYF